MVREVKKIQRKGSPVVIQICRCCRGDKYDDDSDSDPEEHYIKALKGKMMHTFCSLPPLNVLYVFQKYNSKVLSERDKDEVKIETRKEGAMRGAELLLDRLTLYDGWFECLLQALRDGEVKLNGYADTFEKIRDEVFEEHQQQQLERKETCQEERCSLSLSGCDLDDEAVEILSSRASSVSQISILEKELYAEREKNNMSENEKKQLKELL
ncbi:hypothetical protein Btru_033783, partial [Bulinus truncatus]